jgi:hypothetical protein
MRTAPPQLALVVVSVAPLAFVACDLFGKKDASDAAASSTVLLTAQAAPSAPAPDTATPTATALLTATPTATAQPGIRVVKLADGGTAAVNDAGQIVDAGRLVFTMPSGAPSAFVIPSTIPVPSQITIPSAIVVPSGFAIPPFPGAPDAGAKH